MRVMIDTNVLISALLFPESRPAALVALLAEEHTIVLCTQVVLELRKVFRRKFPDRLLNLERFLSEFAFELAYTPENGVSLGHLQMRDKADLPILASAILADVDVIISGDQDFLSLSLERPEILTVNEFQERYGGS
ncbi:MAG: putative toxin-antitoxin system toxin component, PIN family [Firmicutes bacterium]|nr:putative toxin-antitoxin system toxin component, PIN family [Bacillota bacterium]